MVLTPTVTSPMNTAPANAASPSAAKANDGMSAIKGWLDPELRAGLDAVLAKWAAPGMCNPGDETPRIEGEPGAGGDRRRRPRPAQRNHDALNAMVRNTLMSGELGSHQGLPVTITATVELNGSAGQGRDGPHRGRHPAAGPHADPDGRPRLQLSAGLRQRQAPASSTRAAAPGWPPPPNAWCSMRLERGLHPPRLRRPALLVPSASRHHRTGRPAVEPTSMSSPWPAGRDNRLVTDGDWTNQETRRRHHRMDPTTRTRPRPTPHQHHPPPRTHARTRRRGYERRRGRRRRRKSGVKSATASPTQRRSHGACRRR